MNLDKKTPYSKSKTMSLDNIEDFCNLLTPERIKLLNLIFKERHVEIRNRKESRIKDREKVKEKENKITRTIFLNELREVFKKEREKDTTKETKEIKMSKTDRSDFENIIQLLFNRFKVIRDDKDSYETARNKGKSQVANRDSTTKTHKFDKKLNEKAGNGEVKWRSVNKNEQSQSKEKDKTTKDLKVIAKETISDKNGLRSRQQVAYKERRESDFKSTSDKADKSLVKNMTQDLKEEKEKKKDEVGFFLTSSKETKRQDPTSILAGTKVTDFVDTRQRERNDTKITRSDLQQAEEKSRHLEVRIPSQNTENNSIERRTKNHLNETRKHERLEYGKYSELKKSEKIKEKINEKDSVSKGLNAFEEEEELIEAYEIITALCIYARISFKNKMKLLFEVTDVDDDGYINEDEIKKLIYTVHLNFSEEISPVDTKSYTLSQSLACIKAQQILDQIINYPGNLKETIVKEKYVQFENFYRSIEKIPNYTYKVIPTFLNIRTSIETPRKDIDFKSLELKNLNELLFLTKDICGKIKNSVNFMNKVTNKADLNNIIYNKNNKQEESQYNKITDFESRLNRLILEEAAKNEGEPQQLQVNKHHISLDDTMAIIKNNNGKSNDDLQDGEAAVISRIQEVNAIHEKLVAIFSKSSNIKIDHFYIDVN